MSKVEFIKSGLIKKLQEHIENCRKRISLIFETNILEYRIYSRILDKLVFMKLITSVRRYKR